MHRHLQGFPGHTVRRYCHQTPERSRCAHCEGGGEIYLVPLPWPRADPVSGCRAALLWVAKKWTRATHLTLQGLDADAGAAMAEMLTRQTGSRLRSLQLEFLGEAGSTAASGFMWLLWQSPALLYLDIAPMGLSVLPPLTQLQILELLLQDAEGLKMLQALPLFEGLQRLRLNQSVECQEGYLLRTPLMDLSALQHLSWVSLTSISPESFRLRPGCSLRLEVDVIEARQAGNGWPHVQPTVSVKYLSWENHSLMLTRLPRLTRASSLTDVKLHVYSIGTTASPLVIPTALLRLQRLHLVADCICLVLPESVQWTEADINVDSTLLLRFEDCSAFVDHNEALSLQLLWVWHN